MPIITRHPNSPFSDEQVRSFKSKLIVTNSGCWIWTGCRCGDYGRVGMNGKTYTTHKAAFLMSNGRIAPKNVVRHKCDVPLCCRPGHLKQGTHKQNSQDMMRRGRANGPKGIRCAAAILNPTKVSRIKRAINNGTHTQCELARIHGVDKNTVHAIRCELSWREVKPRINDLIPQPHRKFSDIDHAEIRQHWRDGWTLKQLAEQRKCRVDTIQSIINGKRGKIAPVGLRIVRQNKTKHSKQVRQEMLRRYLAGETQVSLRAEYGMSKNGISLALQKERLAA